MGSCAGRVCIVSPSVAVVDDPATLLRCTSVHFEDTRAVKQPRGTWRELCKGVERPNHGEVLELLLGLGQCQLVEPPAIRRFRPFQSLAFSNATSSKEGLSARGISEVRWTMVGECLAQPDIDKPKT